MEILQQAAAVCFVVGLAVLAAYLSRRAKGGWPIAGRIGARGSERLRMVERIALTPQHFVSIVEVDGRELVLGVSPGGITVLGEGGGR
mgnify:CR=1 FL=1